MNYTYLKSPVGLIEIAEENGQIAHISRVAKAKYRVNETPSLKKVSQKLAGYFNGRGIRFNDLKILGEGTQFQKSVWRELRRIPRGEVRTYGDIAKAIGKPKATRAVGSACGKNPHLILTPCHRVVGAHNSLGGFAGGLKMKKQLLAIENVKV